MVAVTQIDLDDEALASVMRIADVRTKKDAVNYALREIAARERRRKTRMRVHEESKDWNYEGWKAYRDAEKEAARRWLSSS